MIRFAHPEYLYLLLLAPVIVGVFIIAAAGRKRSRARFSSEMTFARLAENHSRGKIMFKSLLLIVAGIMLPIALANPQVGTRIEDVKQEGVDLFIALDVSRSMLAEDVKPNRLEKAKYELHNLVNRLSGDRIGLVVFSGEAYTQFPLTVDYSAADMFLDVVNVESVPTPGTAIGSSIDQALKSFDFENPSTKVLVIITDGENNSGDAVEQAKEAAGKGVLIYTIGMGSPAGAPIPVYDGGGKQVDFKRDRSGVIVLTKLDDTALQEIASIGKGKYFRATNSQDELDAIYKDINALQKHEVGAKTFTEFDDKFQYFLFISFLVLLIEVILSDTKTLWLARINPLRTLKEEKVS
jgi:Ca-activated chloride channel family protein